MIEPTGYTALDLIGFTDRGAYDPTANYVKNDIVTVGNTKWRCKVDDTTGVTPAENANWTIYLESATSLAGMSDVTLTSPKNGDGLVHDGNDWKNIPITTKDQWKKNGAYNICPNPMTTHTTDGITYTVRSDGSVEVSGTASQNTIAYLFNIDGYLIPDNDELALVGCPAGGGENTYQVLAKYKKKGVEGNQFARCYGANAKLTKIESITAVAIAIQSGVTITTPIIFKLMITTDLDATYADYVPYAKTNRELTEKAIDFGYVEKDIAGISVNNAADGKYYAIINFSLPAGAVPISVMWGGNGGWQANVSFMLHRGVSAYQVFAIADTAVTISSTNRVIWIFYIKPSIS